MFGNQKNAIYLQGLTLFLLLMYFYWVGDSLFVTLIRWFLGASFHLKPDPMSFIDRCQLGCQPLIAHHGMSDEIPLKPCLIQMWGNDS